MAIGQGDGQNAIAVIIINHKDVVVAREGLYQEFASEIHVGLPGGFQNCSKAEVGLLAILVAQGKGIITRFGWSNSQGRIGWQMCFGGAHILTGLVKMAFKHGKGSGGMFLEYFEQIQVHGPAVGLRPGWIRTD